MYNFWEFLWDMDFGYGYRQCIFTVPCTSQGCWNISISPNNSISKPSLRSTAEKKKKLLVRVRYYCDLGTWGSQDGPSHAGQTTAELSSAVWRGQCQQGKADDKLYEESTHVSHPLPVLPGCWLSFRALVKVVIYLMKGIFIDEKSQIAIFYSCFTVTWKSLRHKVAVM